MAEKFRINEYGEIIREDYFFRQVQNNQVQFLPFERKVWKIYLVLKTANIQEVFGAHLVYQLLHSVYMVLFGHING